MKLRGNKSLKGETFVPGDKSISHRAIILSSLALGTTSIENCLLSEDTKMTIGIFKKLGVDIQVDTKNNLVNINGVGLYGLKAPEGDLYCGNSGTTMRLLAGILAGQGFKTRLTGDKSLSTRPMDRVTKPLSLMGADILDCNSKAPLDISPGRIKAIDYEMEVTSAQVKSAILLASLYSKGITTLKEKFITRNHTEIMLEYLGAKIETDGLIIKINNPTKLLARDIKVPGDISSAAFLIAAGLITKDSDITIKNVGLNNTRTGIISVLSEMGAIIKILDVDEDNVEKTGSLNIMESFLTGITIEGEKTASVIDEIPIIAVLACFAEGDTIIRDAQELRIKESDRLSAIYTGLSKMGADIEITDDGLIIHGRGRLKGAEVSSFGDHRIAMALSIAALAADGTTIIDDVECINVSYPNFYNEVGQLIDNNFEIK